MELWKRLAGCLSALTLAVSGAAAQDAPFPNKPVTLVVPYAAGGTIDLQTRLVGDGLSKKWGQPVVVENRPGAGGMVGTGHVARSKPDGYTLVYIGNPVASAKLISPSVSFDPLTDLAPVINIGYSPLLLISPPVEGVNNVKEFIDHYKADTGKQFYAALTGTSLELEQINFFKQTGLSPTPVYYQGATDAFTAVMTNQVQSFMASYVAVGPLAKAGKIKIIGSTGKQRMALLPDVQTISETLPGFALEQWFGMFVASGTDPKILDKLHADINAVINEPAIKAKLEAFGLTIAGSTPAEAAELMRRDYNDVKQKIEKLGWTPK